VAPTVGAYPYPPAPTVAAQPTPPPTIAAQPTPPPYTNYSGGEISYGTNPSTPPSYSTDPYSSAPPAPPTDPYAIPNTGYPTTYPVPPQPKKKSNVGLIVGGVILAVVLVCGGVSWAGYTAMQNAAKNVLGGTGGTGGNTGADYTEKQDISSLNFEYAGDQISVTSLQQQPKFSDDSYTQYKYSSKANYIRVNFREKGLARYSYVSYRSSITLLLPDGSSVAAENSAELSGPSEGVERSNWVDFGTASKQDLKKLKLRVGRSDEEKMEFALASNADLSKYQPKTSTLNKSFKYDKMDWVLVSATSSLSQDGEQAKTGKVFITVNLTVNNNSSNTYYFYSSSAPRLKAGADTVAPEYSSNDDDLGIIKGGTTNIKGTYIYKVTPATDGQYTLQFSDISLSGGGKAPGPTVQFTLN
jgi:hypothetical protein